MVGVIVGVAVAWPIFFVGSPALTIPIFGFVVVVLGLLGFRVGAAKRDSMIGMFGAGPGMAPPSAARRRATRKIVDTSVAIDGRVVDVVRAGFLHGQLLRDRTGHRSSCRASPTPATTSAAARAAAGSRCSRRSSASPASRSSCSTTRPRRPRGRRQAGPAGHRPGRRAAHPRHQPGQGRRHRRRPGAEPARPRAGAAAARSPPATRSSVLVHQDRQGGRSGRRLPRRRHDGRGRARPRVRRPGGRSSR